MNNTIEHTINSRAYSTFNPINDTFQLDKTKNYLFDLSYLGVLSVNGDKAKDFLQGQLTCDLRQLSDIQMVQGALCNLKGRILALMDIIDWQGIQLILPKDLIESTQLSLSKTAQLSRVTLQMNDHYQVYGYYLQNAGDILLDGSVFYPDNLNAQVCSANYAYYHLGEGFYIVITKQDALNTQEFRHNNQFLGSALWHRLRLIRNQIEIYPESRGLFLPHRLNLHETNYISFDKGCYKGQEIIARTHYRATLKHDLKIFQIQSKSPLFSGQKLLHETTGSEIGELVDFERIEKDHYLIAVSIIKESITFIMLEGNSQPIELKDVC